jgi:uncharacterized membrane protein (DUF373 family)
MLKQINQFEKIVYFVLAGLLVFVLIFSLIELVMLLYASIVNDTALRLDNYELLDIFGFFLLILIGVELLDTFKSYITRQEIHVEVIILIAIIAVARKVILFDPFARGVVAMSDMTLIGLGVIVICLSGGYYLIKKAGV